MMKILLLLSLYIMACLGKKDKSFQGQKECQGVTGFSLIDSDLDVVIANFSSNDIIMDPIGIDYESLSTCSLNIRVNTEQCDATSNSSTISSVMTTFDTPLLTRCSSALPFAVFEECHENYSPVSPGLGFHWLKTTSFTETGCSGRSMDYGQQNFFFHYSGSTDPILALNLFNGVSNTFIRSIQDGDSFCGIGINIEAQTTICGIDRVGFVLINKDTGIHVTSHMEYLIPYLLYGDDSRGHLFTGNIPDGQYRLAVTTFWEMGSPVGSTTTRSIGFTADCSTTPTVNATLTLVPSGAPSSPFVTTIPPTTTPPSQSTLNDVTTSSRTSISPTRMLTLAPSSNMPTLVPTNKPTLSLPSIPPTIQPRSAKTSMPTFKATVSPTGKPSSWSPTYGPSKQPLTQLPTTNEHLPSLITNTSLYCFPSNTDRQRYTNVWGKYIVEVKEFSTTSGADSLCGPGDNQFSRNTVSLNGNDELTLQFKSINGVWQASEVRVILPSSEMPYRYGTYEFSVKSVVHRNTVTNTLVSTTLPPSLVLGLFTWDDTESYAIHENWNHEVDIEISRWNAFNNKDAQFLVQPPGYPQQYRFYTGKEQGTWDQGGHTYGFTWNPGAISWLTNAGSNTSFAYTTKQTIKTGYPDYIQCLPANNNIEVRMNLWNTGGTLTPMGMTTNDIVEVVVDRFTFTPSGLSYVPDGVYCSKHCMCAPPSLCINGLCGAS